MADAEINTLIFFSAIVAALSYTYFLSSNLPKGIYRLISLLPIFYLLSILPLLLSSAVATAVAAFFFTWLANFKLLLFAFDHGPLHPPKSLIRFIAIASVPVKIKPHFFNPKKKSKINLLVESLVFPLLINFAYNHKHELNPEFKSSFEKLLLACNSSSNSSIIEKSSFENLLLACNSSNNSPIIEKSSFENLLLACNSSSNSSIIEIENLLLVCNSSNNSSIIEKSSFENLLLACNSSSNSSIIEIENLLLACNSSSNSSIIEMGNLIVYCFLMFILIDLLVFVSNVVVGAVAGLELEPPSDEPYLSTSLQDFWGRRWNLMVTNSLRHTVYKPVKSVFPAKEWATVPAVMATFLVSGLMHELLFYYVTRVSPTWEMTSFFVFHGMCLVVELKVKRSLAGKLKLPAVVARLLTVGFMFLTSFWLFFPPLIKSGADVKVLEEFKLFGDYVTTLFKSLWM